MRPKLLYTHICPICKGNHQNTYRKKNVCPNAECKAKYHEIQKENNRKYMAEYSKKIRLIKIKQATKSNGIKCRYCGNLSHSRFDVCGLCRERILTNYTYDAILANNVDYVNM
jgi:hypothetical protein